MPWTLADVERSIPDAFLEQVRRRPNGLAVAGSAVQSTYGELDAAANAHAHRVLDRSGSGPGRAALLLKDDSPLFAATLGVLKAGKTAVVLNAHDPPARLEQILDDAQPELVLASADLVDHALSAGASQADVLTIDEQPDEPRLTAPDVDLDPHAAAVLMYTSGSTGPPKGVIHTHRTLLHAVGRRTNSHGLTVDDRAALLVSSGGFGGAIVLWGALLNGAAVCPFLIADRGMAGFAHWAAEQGITMLSTFGTLFRNLTRSIEGEAPPSVRMVILGGEPAMPGDFEACRRLFGPQCMFASSLSSTETGLMTLHKVTGDVDPGAGPLPVGPGNEWVDLLLLDEAGEQVEPGQTGEIAVRCDYLSPGYWGDEALTAARFSEDASGRLYRTGDLGRKSPEGLLTVVGRMDLQVKVRGNRISLTAIENAVAALPDVTGAAACTRPGHGGDPALTAYVTTRPGARVTAASVRHALRAVLPEREIPTAVVAVDSFPATPQGKVDREQLAQITPPTAPGAGAGESTGHSTRTESLLAAIWARAFEIEHVGPDADFFALDGDSLTAAIIAADVHTRFGVRLELRSFLNNPTIPRLASVIDRLQSRRENRPLLARVPRGGPLPVSHAQERTWRTSQTPKVSARYTNASSVRICGPLDIGVLRRTIDHIVRRHEMLRTTFEKRDGAPVQVIHPAKPVDLPLVDLSGAPDPKSRATGMLDQVAEVPFDLRRGPLLRLRLVRTAPEEHQLLWVDHHIITDAWSWEVVFDELRAVYEAFQREDEAPFPDELPLQYADFAAWERSWMHPSTPHYQAELAWWRENLHDAPRVPPRLAFKRRLRRVKVNPSEGVMSWGLPPETSRGLDRLGREMAATYYMVRLAVLAGQLAIETGSEDLIIGTYATGRRMPETQRMLGWFSNLVSLRLRLAPDLSFRQALAAVRDRVIETTQHSEFPYGDLRERLLAEGIAPHEPQLIFNHGDPRNPRIAGLDLAVMRRSYPVMPWGFTFAPNRRIESNQCSVTFDARIYDPARVRGFVERYKDLAAGVCSDPDRPLDEVAAQAAPARSELRLPWGLTRRLGRPRRAVR